MTKPIEKEKIDSLLVIRFKTDLSSYSLDLLKSEVVSEIKKSGYCRLLVNLSEVDYITSGDIGVFVQLYHYLDAAREESGSSEPVVFGLSNLDSFVLDIIKMTRLDTVFKIYKTEEEAIKDLTSEK